MRGRAPRSRRSRLWAAGALELAAAGLLLLSAIPQAAGQAVGSAAPAATSATPAFAASETLSRTFVSNGQTQVVDGPRTFSVSVSQTSGLRNRQVITVGWSGAHPTGGISGTLNDVAASKQEYPVVIMECRGVDSPTAPPAQQLSPSTCWTNAEYQRVLNENGSPAPIWYFDPYLATADKTAQVNVPASGCESSGVEWDVPFVAANGMQYPVGQRGCGGAPPDMTDQEQADVLPGDTTFGVSDLSGSGSVKFSLESAASLPEVGCSSTVACSLVIVPIEGTDCDASTVPASVQVSPSDLAQCETPGKFPPGSINPVVVGADAVAGNSWFLPSEWKNHISVPLSFEPDQSACAGIGGATVNIYGSEMLAPATGLWDPHFCLESNGFDATHVVTAEPEAKNLLASGAIKAAFQALPPAGGGNGNGFWSHPTVEAPVAVSGFAIAYVIDNVDGQPYTDLKLDARLLAKLLTESYAGNSNFQSELCDPGPDPNNCGSFLLNNPISIFQDPEFQALNPTLLDRVFNPPGIQTDAAATLFQVLGQSDEVRALTSYINADPEARAWLNGAPDPWGMVVNPAYKGIQLPVDSWRLLDTANTGSLYTTDPTFPPCLNPSNSNPDTSSLTPARPLIDAPQASYTQVGLNLSFGIAASQTNCSYVAGVSSLNAIGPERYGARFLIGLVPLALARQFDLDTAALETYVSPDAPTKFVDGSDRVFVAPTVSSLEAAAQLLQPDITDGSWTLPYSDFPAKAETAAAYPGTTLISLDAPTQGLDKAAAAELGSYLSYVTTTGQTPGTGVGQLADGYLPLTAANGLGNEFQYSQMAAADVAAQNGQVPSLIPVPTPVTTTTTAPRTTTTGPTSTTTGVNSLAGDTGFGSGGGGSGSAAVPLSSNSSSGVGLSGASGAAVSNAGSASRSPVPSGRSGGGSALSGGTASTAPASGGRTVAYSAGFGGAALPLAMVIAVLGGIVALGGRPGSRPRRRAA